MSFIAVISAIHLPLANVMKTSPLPKQGGVLPLLSASYYFLPPAFPRT